MPVTQRKTLDNMLKIAVALDEKGPMTKAEIAEHTEIKRGTVSKLIDKMLSRKHRWLGWEFSIKKDGQKRVYNNITAATFKSIISRWLF